MIVVLSFLPSFIVGLTCGFVRGLQIRSNSHYNAILSGMPLYRPSTFGPNFVLRLVLEKILSFFFCLDLDFHQLERLYKALKEIHEVTDAAVFTYVLLNMDTSDACGR